MNQKMRKQLKRVVPVTLAVIVLAGFIFGAVGMMVAYAAEGTEDEKSWIEDYEFTALEKIPRAANEYTLRLSIYLTGDAFNDHYVKYCDTHLKTQEDGTKAFDTKDGFMTVRVKELGDFKNGKSGNTFSLTSWPDPKAAGDPAAIPFVYELEHLQVSAEAKNKEMLALEKVSVSYHADVTKEPDVLPPEEINNPNYEARKLLDDTADINDSDAGKTTSGDTDASIPTPKMIISSFDIPSEVAYGEEFDATIEFYNNSAYKDMVNVTMTVTPSEGVSIRNGVNQRHYIKIPKRQSTTERFRFKASDKLAAEAITLTVKFEYEYRFNSEYKQGSHEEVLSLLAKPKPEESSSSSDENTGTEGSISAFELLSIVVPDKVYPDEDAYITIRAINKDHQFDASNVQVTVTGDGLLNSGNTVYYGALEHSKQAEIETTLQFASPGTYPLVCTLVYEDSVGFDEDKKPIVRINDIQKEFTVTVLESPYATDMGGMGDMGDMGDMGMEPGMDGAVPAQGGVVEWVRGHLWAPIGGGVVLLAVIVGVVRHIRRKKAADDDDL